MNWHLGRFTSGASWTLDGSPVTSSSGLLVEPNGALRSDSRRDELFVLPSYGFRALATPACCSSLREASSRYARLAGLDSGSWLLAEAGLLAGRKATIHWHELDAFAEKFPEITAVRERFVIEDDRITCGGAMAAFDLALELIARSHGESLRLEVSFMFMHEGTVAQPLGHLPSGSGGAVRQAVSIMRENLEEPLSVPALAHRTAQTQRSLEQRFRLELGASPRTVYRRLRLLSARKLIDETDMPISEIAVRCGYADPAAMTRAFKSEFGNSPRAVRKNARQAETWM